jgi:hypothetical protein
MILRQARSRNLSVSKALQAFLFGAVLLATQPGMYLSWDHPGKLDHQIARIDNYGDPAFLVGRGGENDKSKRSVEDFPGNVQGLAVVQRFSPLARNNSISCDAPSPGLFKIRSPPVC